MFFRVLRILDFLALTFAMMIAATGDAPRLTGTSDRVRSFTRTIEFDYPNWVWSAAWTKLEQGALGLPYLFDRGTNKEIVIDYLRTTGNLMGHPGGDLGLNPPPRPGPAPDARSKKLWRR